MDIQDKICIYIYIFNEQWYRSVNVRCVYRWRGEGGRSSRCCSRLSISLVEIHGRMDAFSFSFSFTSASNPIPSKLQGCQSISSFVLLTSTLSNWAGNRGHPPSPPLSPRQIIPEVNSDRPLKIYEGSSLSPFVIIFADNLVVGSMAKNNIVATTFSSRSL